MKTILIFMALTMSMLNLNAKTGDNKPEDLVLQGDFLAKKHVRYEIYMVMMDNSLELLDKGKFNKTFSINIGVGDLYVIKFIASDGDIKYLHVDAVKRTTFDLNVDFNKEESAKLIYDPHKAKYKLIPIPLTDIEYVTETRTH